MGLITMKGACDLHIHTGPDIIDRIADDVETATVCRDAGMKAIVLKCHEDTTMTRAWHTQRQVPGIKVFGGIVLNLNVGGINPAAVDAALKLGAVQVWMPTYHSLAHYKATGKLGGYGYQRADAKIGYPVEPITILDEKGELLPAVWSMLELVKQYNAIIGTGHLGSDEALVLIRAAREAGCKKVVLTHPFFAPPSCSVIQIKEAVGLGAFVEFCSGNALSPLPAPISLDLYKEAIEACGSSNFIIASDTGHPRKTMAPETSRMFAQSLIYKGIRQTDVERMLKDNYSNLLELSI